MKELAGELFSFLTKKNYYLYCVEKMDHGQILQQLIALKDITNIPVPNRSVKQLDEASFTYFVKRTYAFFPIFSDTNYIKDIQIEFFAQSYKSLPELRIKLLKEITTFFNNLKIEEFLPSVIDCIVTDKKSLIPILNQIPIHITELEHLVPIFEKHNIEQTNIDKFFLTFIKRKKNALTDSHYGPIVRDFLMEYYNGDREKLSPYLDLSPFLKKKFETVTPDIFLNDYIYSDTIIINIKKIIQTVCLDNCPPQQYQDTIELFSNTIGEHYNLEHYSMSKGSKNKNNLIINFLHNNEKFTQQVFKDKLLSFFQMIESEQIEEPDNEVIKKWLEYETLNEKLGQTTEVKANKIKI